MAAALVGSGGGDGFSVIAAAVGQLAEVLVLGQQRLGLPTWVLGFLGSGLGPLVVRALLFLVFGFRQFGGFGLVTIDVLGLTHLVWA